MKLKEMKIEYWMIAILIVYIPFHLFEESLCNFPLWMQQHHWMANRLTYGHWMAGNIFFYYPLLLAGVFLYKVVSDKFLFTGVAALMWGIMNFLEHSIYSILDLKLTPGFYTSIILALVGILGFRKLAQTKQMSFTLLLSSFVTALFYAFFPIVLQIVFSSIFRKIYI